MTLTIRHHYINPQYFPTFTSSVFLNHTHDAAWSEWQDLKDIIEHQFFFGWHGIIICPSLQLLGSYEATMEHRLVFIWPIHMGWSMSKNSKSYWDKHGYPPVNKHNNGKWTIYQWLSWLETSILFGDFPASHVWWPEGESMWIPQNPIEPPLNHDCPMVCPKLCQRLPEGKPPFSYGFPVFSVWFSHLPIGFPIF